MILLFDFGSQYTQLIAKAFRHMGYPCEVVAGKTSASAVDLSKVRGLVFSGSPMSVNKDWTPDPKILDLNLPILAICYGYHFIASHFGGDIVSQKNREYGEAWVTKTSFGKSDPLLSKFPERSRVWMSHGDSVGGLPPGAQLLLESGDKPAAFCLPKEKVWALQFHPEVAHSHDGLKILEAFASDIVGHKPEWKMTTVLDDLRAELKLQLKGIDEVYCGVSGGVDSTVMAALLSEFCKVKALFVDHGFLREYDWSDLQGYFANFKNVELQKIDARDMFWKELKGSFDPETKRKIIGRLFVEAFYSKIPSDRKIHLAQGTIYSDVIESASNELGPAHKIKSHHNVGGLPKDLKFHLLEPLRKFFKDEVREIGKLLGLGSELLDRHPFPGPGLAIRCLGPLEPERIELLRRADTVFHRELNKRDLYKKTWQAFVVLLPISSVGVMGDERTYESTLAIRAVSSREAMTAEATEFPWEELKGIASIIINEVRGINRVVYDLTSKPPGTIEWE
ncbi:MAG: glutamine-hydrolyzing GMP synthase [Proteobacteria bacterium]|nr:glutamine-hydrolyzing GMP synthase [Pseudomonadota bacterium]